jgi:hypothetical protein
MVVVENNTTDLQQNIMEAYKGNFRFYPPSTLSDEV